MSGDSKKWGEKVLFSMLLAISRVWSEAAGVVTSRKLLCVLEPERDGFAAVGRKGLTSLTASARQPHPTPVPSPAVAALSSYTASADVARETTCRQERARVRGVWSELPRLARPLAVGSVCPGEPGFQGYHILLTLPGMLKGGGRAGGSEAKSTA